MQEISVSSVPLPRVVRESHARGQQSAPRSTVAWPIRPLALAALVAFTCPAAYAATPLGMGEIKSNLPGTTPAGVSTMLETDMIINLEDAAAFSKCPMIVVATGSTRKAVEAERALQQRPEFDPASRVTGKLIDPQYLIDGEVMAQGEAVTWTLRARDAKTGQNLATSQFVGTQAKVFDESGNAARSILSAACEKLKRVPVPQANRIGAGTITMTARYDYDGVKLRDNATSKEVLTYALRGELVLQLVAKAVTAAPAENGATRYFVQGFLTGAKIAKWRIDHQRTAKCMTGKMVTLGAVIATKDEADSFFTVTVRTVGGRRIASVEPSPYIAVNVEPSGLEAATDDITYCSRAPEHMTDGREVKGPVVAPRSLDRRAIEGPVDAGPGIKGVIVSKDLYVVPADWSHLEYAPEDAKVEVTIDLDLK